MLCVRSGQVRSWRIAVGALGLAALALGCEEKRDVPPPNTASPGIIQGQADGPLVDEDETCDTLRSALVERKEALGCDELKVGQCPELIRPAGTVACTRFTEGSLDECTSKIEDYGACGDFGLKRCILVSVVEEMSEGCVPPGADSGASGDAGPGDSGAEPTESDSGSNTPNAGLDAALADASPADMPVDAGDSPADSGVQALDGAVVTAPDGAAPDSAAPPQDAATGPVAVDASTTDVPPAAEAGAALVDAGSDAAP
jgi:hypothetical protein